MNALTPAFKLQVAEVSEPDRDPKQTFPSMHAMGLRLGEIDAAILALEEGFKAASPKKMNVLQRKIDLLEQERAAVEVLVEGSDPQTVADVIVHQAVAMCDLGTFGEGMTPTNETMPQRLKRIHHALLCGMVRMADIHGVDLALIGGDYYLAPWKPSDRPAQQDAELVTLCGEGIAIDRAVDALWHAMPIDGLLNNPAEIAYYKFQDVTDGRYCELMDLIARARAYTSAGLRAKAEFLSGFTFEANEPKDVLVQSLLKDILAGTQAEIRAPRDLSADAELFVAAAAVEKGESFFYQTDWGLLEREMPEDEYSALIVATSSHGHRLIELQAQTREGVLAKARAARWAIQVAVANEPGSTVKDLGSWHERLAFSALSDLLAGDFT